MIRATFIQKLTHVQRDFKNFRILYSTTLRIATTDSSISPHILQREFKDKTMSKSNFEKTQRKKLNNKI